MAKSKSKTKTVKIKFPSISEDFFSGSLIIDDFDTFIEYVHTKGIELTKNEIISVPDCKAINSIIDSKIVLGISRPVQKSYPNVLNLFILFRISGMGELKTKGKKTVLTLNEELYEQWKNFNIHEKYFNLLAFYLDFYSFELINENSFAVSQYKIELMQEVYSKKKLEFDKNRTYYLDSFDYKCLWVMYWQFGFVNLKFHEPEEGQKTAIESIILTNQGKVIMQLLTSLYASHREIIYQSALEDEGIFDEIFSMLIPQMKKSLKLPEAVTTEGIFTFRVTLEKAQRIINIDSSSALDDLCCFILDCFDFDYDHLYMVSLKDRTGRKISYHGCPDMSYAEEPTTEDVKIGELYLKPGSKMEYIYDFGDYWEFEITLDSISPKKGNKKLKHPELIKAVGKAPNQYEWEDEDD